MKSNYYDSQVEDTMSNTMLSACPQFETKKRIFFVIQLVLIQG